MRARHLRARELGDDLISRARPADIGLPSNVRIAKGGVSCIDDARRCLQKGATNGSDVKRRARKLAINRGKRRREHEGEPWADVEKRTICDVSAVCDSKHSHLRQAYLAPWLYYIWGDSHWTDRRAHEKDFGNWVQKASGLQVPETRRFAKTVAKHDQCLVATTMPHINTARAESTSDKIKGPKRRSRGLGGFEETRRRLLLTFGAPGAVEGATAHARRREHQAAAFAAKTSKHKREKR